MKDDIKTVILVGVIAVSLLTIKVVGGFFKALMWIGEKLEEREVDDD